MTLAFVLRDKVEQESLSMRSLSLKISTGNDLLSSLEEIARDQNSFGYVLGILGLILGRS